MTGPLAPTDLREVLDGVGEAWEDLRGARLFLTGCTGFFGAWILESLLAAEDARHLELRATILTRDPEGYARRMPHVARHPAVTLLQGDVRTLEDPGLIFTHVIHGATSTHAPVSPEELLETIVVGTSRVLDVAGRAKVSRMLYLSSGAVYGVQPADLERVPEDHPGAPDPMDAASTYGHGKRLAEHLCALYHRAYGLEIPIARCFAFLAPHLPLDAHYAAGNFLGDGLKHRKIRIMGDGRPSRSYLYGTDLARWLWILLLRGEPCRPYNVGSENAVTIAELARAVALQTGVSPTTAQPPGEGPAPRYVPSTLRARTELGLSQTVDLEEAIRRTLRWHGHRETP